MCYWTFVAVEAEVFDKHVALFDVWCLLYDLH